jgi:hypothetical protein
MMGRLRGCFNRVLAPDGEILSFASPSHRDVVNVVVQEHNPQKKVSKEGDPDAAYLLRFLFSTGGDQRGFLPFDHLDSSLNRP